MERQTKTLIIDASVAVKWFIPEPDSDKATKLRDRHIDGTLTLMAPDLLIYEVANALTYHPELTTEDIKENIEALFMLDLDLIQPSSELAASAAEKARKHKVSLYDSSYIALAEATSSPLITADAKLYAKTRDTNLTTTLDETEDE
jgi:predicted nucleic acid-binding protein